jgi:hypothetical protein
MRQPAPIRGKEDAKMADPAEQETHVPRAQEYPGTPRWVKMLGLVAGGLVLAIVLVLVVGTALGLHTPMGPMGPGMHGR